MEEKAGGNETNKDANLQAKYKRDKYSEKDKAKIQKSNLKAASSTHTCLWKYMWKDPEQKKWKALKCKPSIGAIHLAAQSEHVWGAVCLEKRCTYNIPPGTYKYSWKIINTARTI